MALIILLVLCAAAGAVLCPTSSCEDRWATIRVMRVCARAYLQGMVGAHGVVDMNASQYRDLARVVPRNYTIFLLLNDLANEDCYFCR